MLKFFRRIRQELLSENHYSKYLLYAAGEILLVMIGILLALQVNNWNEGRKNRIEEKYFLSKFKSNLVSDITMLEATIKTNRNIIQLTDSLLIMLAQPQKYDREAFGKHLSIVRNFRRFFPMKITFDNMVASGKVDLIQNQQLGEQLFLYYRYIDEYAQSNSAALANLSRNTITPYFLGFDYWDSFLSVPNSKPTDHYAYRFNVKKKPIQAFANDPFIVNALQDKIAKLERHEQVYRIILEDAQTIIPILESELNK